MTAREGTLYFTVDARLLSQLGKELVADRGTALSELVKNAYDADAKRVTIHFIDPAQGGTLEIRDDGDGMNFGTVRDHWMRLSTGYKERHPTSPRFRRIRGGKKGIGRFAAHSLGERLTLSTTTEGSDQRIVATFDWRKFEQREKEEAGQKKKQAQDESGASLEKIGNPYRIEHASPDDKGTTLRIEGLRAAWSEADLKKVRRTLQFLQPPFPLAEVYRSEAETYPAISDPGFELRIRVGEDFREDEPGIEAPTETDNFLGAATAVVTAEVAEDGTATWHVQSDRIDLDETAEHPKKLLVTGPFLLTVSYFNYKRDAIGDITVKIAREMGQEYGGIRIYRDDLRVSPYGDPGNDWLSLDKLARRREVLYPVSNANWFGHVALSRERNVLLVDTASREGVIENEAFEELRTFVRDVLLDCGRRVARVRGKKELARKRQLPAPDSRKNLVEKALAVAHEAVKVAGEGNLEEAEKVFGRASEIVAEARVSDASAKRHEESLLEEIDLLRVLASLGTSIVVFSHEVRASINMNKDRLADIEVEAEEAPEPWKSRALEAVGEASSAIDRLDDLARFIEGYTSYSRRRDRKAQPLYSILEKFTETFRRLADRLSAELDWKVEPINLRTRPMARSELEAILINLLTNALKAIEGQPHRRIRVTAEEEEQEILLRFQDSGRGIPEEIRESLFEPFVTTSLASDHDLGLGTGLGLKIVQDIAEANRGSVRLGSTEEGFTSCFEVRLRKAKQGAADND